MLKEFKEQLLYRLDRVFAREALAQFMVLAVLVLTVTVIGMTAIFFGLFSPENEDVAAIPRDIDRGFWDALWWSLQQVLYRSGVGHAYGASLPIIFYALFLSIMGLAIFGIMLGLINTAIYGRIQALRKGDTVVKERGHTLILGWSNKVFEILRRLAQLAPDIRIVILAPRDVETMEEALRVEGINRQRLTVILRSGSPSTRSELERVAFDKAASIIVLSQAEEDEHSDSEAIKTLMLLTSVANWPGEPPVLTAEIAQQQNYELANFAAHGGVAVVCSSTVISKVIVQSVRNPGLAKVYAELFAQTGNGIHVRSIPECTDRTVREITYGFPDAVPIGVTWREHQDGQTRNAAGLNPEPDYELADDEALVFVARSDDIRYARVDGAYVSPLYRAGTSVAPTPERVLLIGWNANLYDILSELDAHSVRGTTIVVLSAYPPQEAAARVERFVTEPLDKLSLEFILGDSVQRSAYAALDLECFDSIVVLADESAGEADADARTLRSVLRLADVRKRHAQRAHTVIELLDGASCDLLADLGVDDVVVSPEVVSAQLAQIARQRILAPIYRELLSAGGTEISLRPVNDYLDLDVPCRFVDLVYAAQQRMEIALGLSRGTGNNSAEVLLNPSRDETWALKETDRLVVLAQQVYR